MIELIRKYKKYKPMRKHYHIEPRIRFGIDSRDYFTYFIPTITWCPWFNRYPGESVVCIQWLNGTIGIGVWKKREEVDEE